MINPKISVIMLTYNRRQYLDRSIRAVLAQNFTDYEFIIVDNGSTDESGSICDSYAQKDSRIKVIHKEKGNIGSGRNAGVRAAGGGYIAFVDDDDYAYPDMLSFLYNLAIEKEADISLCGSDIESKGEIRHNFFFNECLVYTPQEAIVQLLDRRLLNAATPTKLFKKSILDAFSFSEEAHYEDIFITYKLMASANRVAAHGLPKYCFVRHEKNNSGFTSNDSLLSSIQLEEYFEAYNERTVWLTGRFPELSEVVVYSEWSFLISMYNKIISNNLAGFEGQKEYITKILNAHKDEFWQSPYCKSFEYEYLRRYFPK